MTTMKIKKLKHLSKKERSKRSEKQLAKLFGGRVQPASGAIPVAGFKGDVKTPLFLFDDKHTVRNSFQVKQTWLENLRKQAFQNRRKPVVRVQFDNGRAWYIVSDRDFMLFKELLEKYES